MAESMVECEHCQKFFHKKGLGTHRKACMRGKEILEDEARYQSLKKGVWTIHIGECACH